MMLKHWSNLKANKTILIGAPRTGGYYVYDKLYDSSYTNFDEILFCKNNVDCKKVIEDKINNFNLSLKCVAKVIPGQTPFDKKFIKRQCFKLCEMADQIIYTQRKNTFEQVISYAVAVKQFDIEDVTPWRRNRKVFNQELHDSDLDKAFNTLADYHNLVTEIFNKYPSKVFTLEDLEYKPYPNRYIYTGSWTVPYNFKMLESNG